MSNDEHSYVQINLYHPMSHTWCYNLIPGIVAAWHWGVESGKLMYSRTFGHASTRVYISHRPNESFVPEQQRK